MSADARSYLAQQLSRLQASSKTMHSRIELVEASVREVQRDLINVIAALDDLAQDSTKAGAA